MVWRETVHFPQARSMMIPVERGVTTAGAVKSIRVPEDAAARDIAGKSFRAQEV
jgi:hypothetical protein